ncbi:hypothetical protein BV96_00816 [Sphingomonas paucimobilis]|nr:hypothetical protein BV96_00816 [Sphingomonas paucimobilis]
MSPFLPFTLSLSKGATERSEVSSTSLSPNGNEHDC